MSWLAVALFLSVEVVAPTSGVYHVDDHPRLVAPHGQAWIQLLHRGNNAYLGRLELAPGAAIPEHADATEEYIHVLEGTGTVTIDGKAHAVKPGSTVYMAANAKVSFQNGDAKLVAIQVFAGPDPAEKYNAWKRVP